MTVFLFDGTSGATVTTAAEVGATSRVVNSGSVISYDNAMGAHGTGLRFNTAASVSAILNYGVADSGVVRMSVEFTTPASAPSAAVTVLSIRNTADAVVLRVGVGPTGNIALWDGSGTGSTLYTAAPWGTRFRIYLQATVGTTTSNGGIIGKVFNTAGAQVGTPLSLTNANTTTSQIVRVRLGDTGPAANFGFDELQIEPGAGAEIGAYVYTAPLATPVVTVADTTNPTELGGTDGTIQITWPPVSGAERYEAAISSGNVTSGFVASDTNAVSPKTFTGLTAGEYTVAVRAIAGA